MLDPTIASELNKRGHDAAAVQGDASLEGLSDTDLLRAARERDRVVVTDNVADLARLHQLFITASEVHAGIICASPGSVPRSKRTIGVWVSALDAFLRKKRGEDMTSRCCWL